jgi:hypothetical protein
LPEGKPFFALPCIELMLRNGIQIDEAEADFGDALDLDITPGRRFRAGASGLYEYREIVVFGQRDVVVVQMWIRE